MLGAIALLLCLGTGTIGGVFFAFSTFVMRALHELPPHQGAAAMQRINVVVINPIFLGVFMGTTALGIACAVLAFLPWQAPRSPLLLAAAFLYVVGTFFVTMAFNGPMNNRLARLDPSAPEAAAYWPIYVRDWSRWNHVRTAAAPLAAACSGGALIDLGRTA